MTLANFMDASYVLLVEEHQRIDPLKDFLTVGEKILPTDAKTERVPTQRDVKAQNKQAMEMLQGALKGVQGAPNRKPRRA